MTAGSAAAGPPTRNTSLQLVTPTQPFRIRSTKDCRLNAKVARAVNLQSLEFLQPLGVAPRFIAIKPRDRFNRQIRGNRSDASLQNVRTDARCRPNSLAPVRLSPSDSNVTFEGATKMTKMAHAPHVPSSASSNETAERWDNSSRSPPSIDQGQSLSPAIDFHVASPFSCYMGTCSHWPHRITAKSRGTPFGQVPQLPRPKVLVQNKFRPSV